ncbi:MAG: DUF835 domain-containing protein [Candidatus Natronoplasma sp.]
MEFANEFDIGSTCLLETEEEASTFEVFRSLLDDRPGLCITKKTPASIKDKYGLDRVQFGHLSTSEDPTTIGPKELNLLALTIKKFVSEDRGVVLFEGIDYLIAENDISSVIRFIHSTQDRISGGSSMMLIVLNTSELDERDLRLLKNRLDLEVKSLEKSVDEKRKTSEQGEHLVSQVRSMMEFLREQEDYIEKEEDKIDKKSPSGVSDFMGLESLKDEIKALRKENRTLKNELENIKTERQKEGKDEVFEEEIVNEVVAKVEEEKKDIKEQMEKIEEEKEKKQQEDDRMISMIETLRKLEKEVGSLRDEVKTIKEGSSKRGLEGLKEEEVTSEESEEEFDIIIDSASSADQSDVSSEGDIGVIQEPKLEDEYLSEEIEEKESAEKVTDDRIRYDGDNIILKSDSKFTDDIESKGSIEVQEGVTLNGSLKSEEDIIIDENTTIQGEIMSKSGDVDIGKDCKVTGEISANSVSISERSKVEDINAKKEVLLENNTRVRNISCQGDVRIFENVEIDGGIDYGGQLDLNGDYINIRGRIRPVENEEEVVKEKWV